MKTKSKQLFKEDSWNASDLPRVWEVIERSAAKFGFDYYTPNFQIVSSQQMIDVCANHAMPISLPYWRNGQAFLQEQYHYLRGRKGLAYEVVINTDPCYCYLMEDNNSVMTTMVMAHAAVGHSMFFKHNYLFKGRTDARMIIPFLDHARNFILDCEKIYGASEVEYTLDMIYTWEYHGFFKSNKPKRKRNQEQQDQINNYLKEKHRIIQLFADGHVTEGQKIVLLNTLDMKIENRDPQERNKHTPIDYDDENILYFIEKYSKSLSLWQIELVRIVRKIQQYFYPQMLTKIMNEGWASFVHYTIMEDLMKDGYITDGQYIDFLSHHASVLTNVRDDEMDNFRNPYWLGYNTFRLLRRACESPTKEDEQYFPEICNTDWKKTLRHIMENYRDSSWIYQYMHPELVRDGGFAVVDVSSDEDWNVIRHDATKEHFEELRKILADSVDGMSGIPTVKIIGVTKDELNIFLDTHKNRDFYNYDDLITALSLLRDLTGYKICVTVAEDGIKESFSLPEFARALKRKNEEDND